MELRLTLKTIVARLLTINHLLGDIVLDTLQHGTIGMSRTGPKPSPGRAVSLTVGFALPNVSALGFCSPRAELAPLRCSG